MASIQVKLTELMANKNITALDIEKTTGLNKNTINSILTGTSKNPSANTLRLIAQALDVSLESILMDDKINLDALSEKQLEVYRDTCTATINMIIVKDLKLSIDKLTSLIKEVYQYSIKVNPPEIDERFIEWMVDKYKS